MPFNLFMIFVNVPFSPKKKLWWKFFVVEKKDNFYDILKTHTHTQDPSLR